MMSNRSTSSNLNRISIRSLLAIAAILVLPVSSNFAFADGSANEQANTHQKQVVALQAASLEQMSDQLRDEIKNHLKSSKNYRELLNATNRIRVRSASVVRKINRNSEYRGLQRDLDQVQEQMVELDAIGKELQAKSIRKIGSEIPGHTISKLGLNIQAMLSVADRMARGEVIVAPVVEPIVGAVPAYDPVFDVAPSFDPIFEPGNQPTQIESPVHLMLEGPVPERVYSVLEKN